MQWAATQACSADLCRRRGVCDQEVGRRGCDAAGSAARVCRLRWPSPAGWGETAL